MKVIILDGANETDPTRESVLSSLNHEILARGWKGELILLRKHKIGNCGGDFFCWIRSPGLCNIDDDNRRIAQSITNCDILVFLTPIAFGGYSSVLKRMLDHMTQNNLPFFTMKSGEIHHPHRYGHTPKLLAIGWTDRLEPEEEAIFHHLVQRNAINMHFSVTISRIFHNNRSDENLQILIRSSLENLENGKAAPGAYLPTITNSQIERAPIQQALVLIGSPRGRKSTSSALGGYLAERLIAHGIPTETIQVYPALGSQERTRALLEAVNAKDLIILAFPLYIDGLPGPVMRLLELIAAQDPAIQPAGKSRRAAFTAIVNSGLPEAEQNQTALAICAQIARRAGYTWAGGLALGAGYSVVNGTHLDQLGWRGASIREALELSASSLASGHPIPSEAVKLMAKRRISNWMFLLLGPISWLLKAWKYGAVRTLWRQPYKA